MRNYTIPTVILCLLGNIAAADIHLTAGQQIVGEFNPADLSFLDTRSIPEYCSFAMTYGADQLNPGEEISVELYANSLNDSPFGGGLYEATVSNESGVSLGFDENYWQDMQGMWRITMVTGSVDLPDTVTVSVINDYQDYIGQVPVPEPAVAPAALVFATAYRRFRR
jgi:hypothetical protein